MKKCIRNILIIVLSIILSAISFTSCNDKAKNNSDDSSHSTSTSMSENDISSMDGSSSDGGLASAESSGGGINVVISLPPNTTSSKSTSSKSPDGKTSLYGKTITVSSWVTSSKPKLGQGEGGDASYYAMEWAKKKYNVQINWKISPETQYFTEYAAAALSGNSYSDIPLVHSQVYLSWIKDGLIAPLNSYMADKSDKYWDKQLFTLNGNLYGIRQQNRFGIVPEFFLLYNTKMLQSLNLQSPQELALKGQWTWAKFREYCKKATNASTKTFGVHAFMLPDALRYTNNVEPCVVDNGVYYNGYSHGKGKERTIELLTFLQDMMVKDRSIMGTVTGGADPMNESMNAFMDGQLLFTFGRNPWTYKRSGFKDYAPVTFPIGPSGNKVTDIYLDGFSCWGIAQNTKFDKGDLVNFWVDSQITWDKSRGDAYYEGDMDEVIEDYYSKNFMSRKDAEFMFEMGKNMKARLSYSAFLQIGGIEVYNLFQPILTNQSTPAAVIEATDNQIQSVIDGLFNSKPVAKAS